MKLTCERTTELLDGYLNRELDDREVEDVECHLASCAECHAFLEWITDALVNSERVPEKRGRGALTKSIMEKVRIVATERDASGLPGRGSDLPRPGRRRVPAPMLAAVAAALFLVASILLFLNEEPREAPQARALALLWRSDGDECLDALKMLEAGPVDVRTANEMLRALDPTMEPTCLATALRIAESVGWENLRVPRWIEDWRERLREEAAESSTIPVDDRFAPGSATSDGVGGQSLELLDVLAADSFGIELPEYTDPVLGELLAERRRQLMRLAWRLDADAARTHLLEILRQRDSSDADRLAATKLLGADLGATADQRLDILQGLNDALEYELVRDPKSALVGACLRAAGSIIRSGVMTSEGEAARFRGIVMEVASERPHSNPENLAHALTAVRPLLSAEEAVNTFFSLVEGGDSDHRVPREAIRLLGGHWNATVASRVDAALAGLLRHSHGDVRNAVLGLLYRNALSATEKARVATALTVTLPEIIRIARDAELDLMERRSALMALAAVAGESTAERALLDLLRDSEGEVLRALLGEVERSPGVFGGREWTSAVRAIALDGSKYGELDRATAIVALGSVWLTQEATFGESSFADPLLPLCRAGSPTLRRIAIRTLGEMANASQGARRESPSREEVITKAEMLLQDENYGVRVAALHVLEQLDGESVTRRRIAVTWLDDAAVLDSDDSVLEHLVEIATVLAFESPDPVVSATLGRLVEARPDSRAGRSALLALVRARAGISNEVVASLPSKTWRDELVVTVLRVFAGAPGSTQALSRLLDEAPEAFLRAANADWSNVRDLRQNILALRREQPIEDAELIAILEVALLDPALRSRRPESVESELSVKDVWRDYLSLQGELSRRVREYLDAPEKRLRIQGARLLQWMEGPGVAELVDRVGREADLEFQAVALRAKRLRSEVHGWILQVLDSTLSD